ncbi:TrkH family potassium uptake protein [Henriciella mobilis]|uniref:TrkH family potassium uptake protein n=1 Tax=Henriciella mobilis TaxID=2305467 RepID=A0A399R997_9PROT|nr:TrkH family potassium uptake protein [Henriciella mobilis]RIJ28136.1 TrkH family potassium uptake protein [Henriciella mobilis]
MNFSALIRMLSFSTLLFSGGMIVCALAALIAGETTQLLVFLVTAILMSTLAAAALVLTGTPRRRAQPSDGLAFMVIFWFVMALVSAPPFLMGVANSSVITAIHEAVSCLSTTGHTAFDPSNGPWPASLVLWRAILNLAGAVATITFAATVLAALNLDGPGIHRTHLFSLSDESFFDSMPRVLRMTVMVMAICVLIVFAIEVIGGIPPHTAFLDAASAFSTGLADPAGHQVDVTRHVRAFALFLGLLMGSLGLFFLLQVGSGNLSAWIRDPELGTLLVAIAVFAILAAFCGLSFFNAIGWAVSAISTSGIALVSPSSTHALPLALQLAPPLIGGAALSTTGGIKLARIYVLSRRVGQEFVRMGYRQSLLTFEFRRRIQSDRTIMGVWVYLVAYIMACVGGLLLFSFSGSGFENAISNTVGSLTNSAHLVDVQDLPGDRVTQVWLILGMILGRLEVLAFIPLFTASFWHR